MIYQATEILLKMITDEVYPSVGSNEVYQPVVGQRWLRTTLMPGKSTTVTLGRQHCSEYQGLFRIDVFFDKGENINGVNEVVDTLIKQFKANMIIDGSQYNVGDDAVVYIGEVWRETARYEPVWGNIPVYVSWKTIYHHNQDQ